jgi:PTS system nitrogen regulatory IIA component
LINIYSKLLQEEEMNDIMTIEEVAEYLRVSERTVYDWVQKGEIPGGKIGTSWRFKRSEIENWVNRKLTPRLSADIEDFSNSLKSVLSPESVIKIISDNKWDALEEMSELIIHAGGLKYKDELMNALRRREELMSTGIGWGIAVPHVRLESVKSPVMALGVSNDGLSDYESLDGLPVQYVIMIAAGKYQHAEYIKLLSMVSARMKNEDIKHKLLNADEEEMYKIFSGGTDS